MQQRLTFRALTYLPLLLFAFIFSANTAQSQVYTYTDADAAQRHADTSLKPILIVFSGSDWCKPCMLFEREVLDSEAFATLANGSLIVLKADFPRKRKNQLPEAQRKQNDRLAADYNPEGRFPWLVLRDSTGMVLWKMGYTPHSPAEFMAQLSARLPKI